MERLRKQAASVLQLLRSTGPEKEVPKVWLVRTDSRLDAKFAARTTRSVTEFEGQLRIEINGQVFLWPKNSPLSRALQILSEILTPNHPHQYLYGHTTINRNDVVMDIGACEGAFSAVVTSRCARVIAVEPSRSMCAMMPELFRIRNEPCPLILNCLLGARSGIAYFLEDRENPGHSMIASEPVRGESFLFSGEKLRVQMIHAW